LKERLIVERAIIKNHMYVTEDETINNDNHIEEIMN